MVPANQLRLSFTGSEDGEAETETGRAAKPLWRTTTQTSGPPRAQLARTAVCGPACTVVRQGRVGDHSPYADLGYRRGIRRCCCNGGIHARQPFALSFSCRPQLNHSQRKNQSPIRPINRGVRWLATVLYDCNPTTQTQLPAHKTAALATLPRIGSSVLTS